jgi:fumarate hydratase class I
VGAQFGGRYFCHDVRVVRLPRHGGSLPIGIGVSCNADRQIKAKINADGVFLEDLERNPGKYLPDIGATDDISEVVNLDLNRNLHDVLADLKGLPVGTRLSLSGPLTVARDAAHKRLRETLNDGRDMPDYMKEHPVYYASPAKTPNGMISGAFGPTTGARMDPFLDQFMGLGASLVSLSKGNRSRQAVDACRKHGGFYLSSIGGAAAVFADEVIKSIELIDFEDLGMEAVWRITVEKLPAFIAIDDRGNDFYAQLSV